MFAVLGFGFSACQREAQAPQRAESGVTFTVRTVDAPPAKAAIYPEGTLPKNAGLGLVAYKYETGNAAASAWTVLTKPALTPLILDDAGSGGNRTDGSGKWIPAPGSRLLWPREGFVRYFGFAPYSAVSGTFTDNQAPVLAYSVPTDVGDQVDLLVSTPGSTRQYSGDPSWRNIDVPMDLQHALTGVRFRLPEGLEIISLNISGAYASGSLDLSAPTAWSGQSGSAAYTLTNLSLGNGLRADSANPGFNITDDNGTLILMPQSLPAGATISVVLSNTRSITASIAGFTWPINTLVTYTITRRSGLWVLLAEVNNFGNELSDVVVSPVNMTEFESEDGGPLEISPDGTSESYQHGVVPDFV